MRYLIAADFILEMLCVLCMFSFVLGKGIKARRIPGMISALLIAASLGGILSDAYQGFIIFLVFVCIFPLFISQPLYYVSWFMVYNLGFNFISMIVQIMVFACYGKFYLSTPSVLPVYAAIDNVILVGLILLFYALRKTEGRRMEILKLLHRKDYALLLCTCLLDYIILLVVSSFFASTFLSYNLNEKGKAIFFFTLVLLILIGVAIFYFFCSALRKNITLQEINRLNAENLALEQKYFETLYQKNEDLRAFRHDFQNHVLALNSLVQERDWEGIQQYLSKLTAIKEQVQYYHTNSAIADAIVNEFYHALPADISFHMEGKFPNDLWIADLDLSIMISNLLRNAREACELLGGEREKEIILEIQRGDGQLLIRTENSSRAYSPEEIMYLETGKEDSLNNW